MEEVVLGRRGRHGDGRRQQENPRKFTYEEQAGEQEVRSCKSSKKAVNGSALMVSESGHESRQG